jgi:hypothetical protein
MFSDETEHEHSWIRSVCDGCCGSCWASTGWTSTVVADIVELESVWLKVISVEWCEGEICEATEAGLIEGRSIMRTACPDVWWRLTECMVDANVI